jgi:glycerophosphoryl diester phosphodiesterase
MRRFPCLVLVIGFVTLPAAGAEPVRTTHLVGHRGLFQHAPENTLAGFSACLALRLGFELDIRRTRDGQLVCLHDESLARTTGQSVRIGDLTLAEVRKLDAGRRFDPAFTGERVPTLDEVFALLKRHPEVAAPIALDFKIGDDAVEADVVALAKQHGVLGRVVCIGRTIDQPIVRRRLRTADPKTPTAVLAQTADELPAALADRDSDWVYVRFVPTAEQAATIHKAGKRILLAGVTVAGNEPANWRKARDAGVDVILTDFPLECRSSWK